jgi:hypothetical protein
MRAGVEDLLVIDAMTYEPVYNLGGKLSRIDYVDGATINPMLDEKGRRPMPPDVAYQQVLHGVPAVDFNAHELIYAVRNPRSNKRYGFGPVEQITLIINTALRRDLWRLQEYTEGTIPDGLAQVPEDWTQDQIADFQKWWDGLHENNTAQRRHLRFLPALKDLVFPKKDVLKDSSDEWLARIICWAFSLSPNALIQQVNRSTAETVLVEATDEGQETLKVWWKTAVMDLIVHFYFKSPDFEFAWQNVPTTKVKDKAEADSLLVTKGIKGIDEVREELGLEPLGIGPMVYLANGVLPIASILTGTTSIPGGAPIGGAPGGPDATHEHDQPAPGDEVAARLERIALIKKKRAA